MAFDLADRPVLGPIQAMQVVDLFGRQHGSILIYKGRLPLEPGHCSLQDSGGEGITPMAGEPFLLKVKTDGQTSLTTANDNGISSIQARLLLGIEVRFDQLGRS